MATVYNLAYAVHARRRPRVSPKRLASPRERLSNASHCGSHLRATPTRTPKKRASNGQRFYIYVSPIGDKQKPTGWKVKWEYPDRSGGSKNFLGRGSKRDADRYARQVQHDFETNTHVRRQDGKQTFGAYARAYVDSTKRASLTERSWINLDGRLRNHLLPILGEEPLGDIDAERVRLLLADLTLEKRLSAATVKPVYNLLNKIMSQGGHRPQDPLEPVRGDRRQVRPAPRGAGARDALPQP